ncbi:MAG: hypothetical protein ACREUS_10530 [Burkholderiales bacterium]
MQTELLLVVIAKALAELVAMFLLGRGFLYLLAGAKRDTNIFYQVLCVVTNPVLRATRWITPRVVIDRHVPYVAFALVVWVWLAIVFWLLPEMCGWASIDCRPLLEQKRAD